MSQVFVFDVFKIIINERRRLKMRFVEVCKTLLGSVYLDPGCTLEDDMFSFCAER